MKSPRISDYRQKKLKVLDELLENSQKILLNVDENYVKGLLTHRTDLFEKLKTLDREISQREIRHDSSDFASKIQAILSYQQQIIQGFQAEQNGIEKRLSNMTRQAQTKNYLKLIPKN